MVANSIAFNSKINPQLGQLGGVTTFRPRVAPATTGNEYGISIPTNFAHTVAEDGNTQISMGNDGNQLRHISNSELEYMQKEKGLGNHLFGIM